MNELALGYRQTDYHQNFELRANHGHIVRINYGYGKVEEIELPEDFGQCRHHMDFIRQKCLDYEKRTSQKPEVLFENRKAAQLVQTIEISTLGANSLIACSLLPGFLDRYRITLAARIDGFRVAIGFLSDMSKTCAEKLPKALAAVERLTKVIEKNPSAHLLAATEELAITMKQKEGLDVCVKHAQEYLRLVGSMEQVNEAMAGKGFATKLQVFLANIDMACVRDAMKDYTLGEQSLGALITAVSSVGVGFSVRDAVKTICTNVLNMSELKKPIFEKNIAGVEIRISESYPNLVANIAGVAAGIYVATYGDSLLQAAGIGLCAYATKYAAKAIGMGIQIFKSCIPKGNNG